MFREESFNISFFLLASPLLSHPCSDIPRTSTTFFLKDKILARLLMPCSRAHSVHFWFHGVNQGIETVGKSWCILFSSDPAQVPLCGAHTSSKVPIYSTDPAPARDVHICVLIGKILFLLVLINSKYSVFVFVLLDFMAISIWNIPGRVILCILGNSPYHQAVN